MFNIKTSQKEKGQILVMVVVAITGLAAILALAFDGGMALMNRRNAQVAADAGALAGARFLCTGFPSTAANKAVQYATVENAAQSAIATVLDDVITVETSITHRTFFAGILGIQQITSEAAAAARCFSTTSAVGALPVAWACRPPISEPGGTGSADGDCQMQSITTQELATRQGSDLDAFHATYYDDMYIIMDSSDVSDDFICIEPDGGLLQCDFSEPPDGENELLAGGDRSWLDIDGGGGGANELTEWMENGFSGEILIHTWLPKESGTEAATFLAAATRVGDIVVIPVFDAYCDGYPTSTANCINIAHADGFSGADIIVDSAGSSTLYFHITGFAAFYISCVDAGPNGPCPGHTRAVDYGAITNNEKTIEGYFIDDFFAGGIGGWPNAPVNTGLYTVYLIQ